MSIGSLDFGVKHELFGLEITGLMLYYYLFLGLW